MANKVNLDLQLLNCHELHSPYEKLTARETNRGENHLSQYPKGCKKQTSDEELEEARRRGCYTVLPPVLGPHEKARTMDELLREIDEQVRRSLRFMTRSAALRFRLFSLSITRGIRGKGEEMDKKTKRDLVAVYMESPIYFTVPLRRRLELINRQPSCSDTRNDLLDWVKTGHFNISRFM